MTTTTTITETVVTVAIDGIPVKSASLLSIPGLVPETPTSPCLLCRKLLNNSSVTTPSSASGKLEAIGIQHHDLDALAQRAANGCHLCLTVYMSIDPDALRRFQRTGDGKSLGYAQIQPLSSDQARLTFKYSSQPDQQDVPSLKGKRPVTATPSSTVFKQANQQDVATLKGQRPATAIQPSTVFKQQHSSRPSSRPSEQSTSRSGDSFQHERESDRAGPPLGVELILMNPTSTTQLGVRNLDAQSVSTSSKESFDLARQWLKDCSFDHMKCSVNDNGPIWKPTHLLDVTIRGHKGVPGVKLVDGMFLDPLSEYVTLSHCWGSTKSIQLHKRTLQALRKGVAGTSLPKTFAEAAIATEKLGFRYLWIDALCIQHDNEQAVLKEISQMHRVYSEASLNLAATGSKDDAGGLFHERNVTALQPPVVQVAGHGIDDGMYHCLRATVWQDLVDLSPLSRRAWAFQERGLAKRTLHFTRNELLWECRQTCCTEVFPLGLPVAVDRVATQPLTGRFNKKAHHQTTANWHELVHMYSKGKLTYSSDKLLALSGLARNYVARNRGVGHYVSRSRVQESDYLAGLWRSQLPHALLWRVEKGHRPTKYRAPSWTWASIDGTVTCPAPFPEPGLSSHQTCVEIVDIQLAHKGDAFGAVEHGRLKVRGFMARGYLPLTRNYWGATPCVIECPQNKVAFKATSFDDRIPKLIAEGSAISSRLEVYLMLVIDIPDRVEGLVLCRSRNRGEFRRMGTFEVSKSDEINWDRLRKVMKGDPEMDNYEERLDHRGGQWTACDYTYTVNII